MTTSAQIRAARHLVSLSQAQIAEATGLSLPTIKRAESDRDVSVSADAIRAIRAALESAGVIFVDENGEGPGVRLRKERQ
ncbi:MAG: helix-turn-helix transcriptional regulator [Mesorhizobium sp.]